ncbi:hypothetical protein [uncultured Marivirga sp.]|uniref:hypothetical protein n=1 Tax=uncultured Marivirga sp. TaxID=1123707 RepID=UPI0030EF2E09|tara:strand:- start:277915 stop:278952 length:1038 start_codon:yes stop_codon:yes gene_type:complete
MSKSFLNFFDCALKVVSVLFLSASIYGCKIEEIANIEKEESFTIPIEIQNSLFNFSKPSIVTDQAILMLPKGYSSKVRTKLVIYCHSGGGGVTSGFVEALNSDYCRYLNSLGYAVLDVAGIPETVASLLKIDQYRTVGSKIALDSYFQAYSYVVKNYNIGKDEVYLLCNSNGSLVGSNLVNLTKIPFKAQAFVAPLLSIERNAWDIRNGALSGGEFDKLQTRANIIRLYGMKNVTSLEDLMIAEYEKDKVGDLDPFNYIMARKAPRSIPIRIFQAKDDPTASFKLNAQYVERFKDFDIDAEMIAQETGGHTSEPLNYSVGLYLYKNQKYNLTPTVQRVGDFFSSY